MTSGADAKLLAVFEDWRRVKGMTHNAFARWLERDVVEWAHARKGRRRVPRAMVALALQKADAEAPLWVARINNAIAEDALARVS